jgi:hypothetical protein
MFNFRGQAGQLTLHFDGFEERSCFLWPRCYVREPQVPGTRTPNGNSASE